MRLPAPLRLPFRLVPAVLHSTVLAGVLDRVLAAPRRDGELDFLFGRTVAIRVDDTGVEYRLFLGVGGFYAGQSERPADVSMSGDLYDFLLLATRREDPDTLFFQRRLRIEGDTALGLQLKNLLDSLEFGVEELPPAAARWLDGALAAYRRVCGAASAGSE
ncbi:MAG TPA: SCP2 sterol-binding domain-containing protein [Gammaproteobacteria bacterium]